MLRPGHSAQPMNALMVPSGYRIEVGPEMTGGARRRGDLQLDSVAAPIAKTRLGKEVPLSRKEDVRYLVKAGSFNTYESRCTKCKFVAILSVSQDAVVG
ncbi:hypothetical protein FSP39_006784 [Pinctada imbricata]|uniref:Uncharacterized protein n=1 Tax=Pinctada imbricata TaxID=66713 RepID=A0AA89BYM6_PINIB|nr:hypothetical protein FSP39_006784 [Pinctada imbricata]